MQVDLYNMQGVGFDVDDFLVDLFYYFNHSTKQKAELTSTLHYIVVYRIINYHPCACTDFAVFCNVTYRKVIKHISVRWLTLQTAVERALLQYSALKSYFVSKGIRS